MEKSRKTNKKETRFDELQRVVEHRFSTLPQMTFKKLAEFLSSFSQKSELLKLFLEKYLTPIFAKKLDSIEKNNQLERLKYTFLLIPISGELEVA